MTDDSPSAESETRESLSPSAQRKAVRQRYASVAEADVERNGTSESRTDEPTSCCDGSETDGSSCCSDETAESRARTIGYSPADVAHTPDGANLGLGCGNPKAIADLEAGETVLDLGSGGGFDCFLAAREVGRDGRVIGVDMTPEMVERARSNAEENGFENVEFRLGEIEHLPVPDETVDVVISNCVINLSPAKRRVFEDAYRVLEPGGRLAISDIVMTPDGRAVLDRTDPEQISKCIAGAATVDTLREIVEAAGFESVSIRPTAESEAVVQDMGEDGLDEYIFAATIRGVKPTV